MGYKRRLMGSPKSSSYIELICEGCGKKFQRLERIHRRKLNMNYKKTFCSRECSDRWRAERGECCHCGSKDIYHHGLKSAPKYICYDCLVKWRKKHNKDAHIQRNWPKCVVCGRVRKIPKSRLKSDKCSVCERMQCAIYYRYCEFCDRIFVTPRKKARFCSRRCANINHLSNCQGIKFKAKELCSDCGVLLNDQNRTHQSHSHNVCDICHNDRRRKYKDTIIFGRENADHMKKIRILENIALIGIQRAGGKPWRRIDPIMEKKLQRLRSEL